MNHIAIGIRRDLPQWVSHQKGKVFRFRPEYHDPTMKPHLLIGAFASALFASCRYVIPKKFVDFGRNPFVFKKILEESVKSILVKKDSYAVSNE